jgi:2-methylcitrate dehydratase PrpD
MMHVTEELAQFIAGCSEVPAEARDAARRAFIDTIGVMLAGSREDCARIAGSVVRGRGSRPVSAVVGQGFRTSPEAAALVNGLAAHALDFDDVNSPMTGHPSVPLVPAILAVAEETGAGGRAALDAYVIGFEVEVKLGRAIGPSHYSHGWHATGTLGVIAAAAAAGRLYGLDGDRMRMAIGIAASMAGGMRQNFGTMTKPLHPGYAAQNGIVAAQLAAGGFTADASVLEAPIGYLSLFSPEGDADSAAISDLGRPFEILASGMSVKYFPCCYATHRAIEATLGILAEEPLSEPDIAEIAVRQPRGAGLPLIHSRPVTGLEGKFSMEYCVAAALLDGSVGLDSFEDAAVQREAVQRLLRRVDVRTTEEECRPAEGYAEVQIDLKSGRRLIQRLDDPSGSPDRPLTLDQLADKYRDCAKRILGREASDRALELIMKLDQLDSISTLTDILMAPAAVAAD